MSTYVTKYAKERGLKVVDATKALVVQLSAVDIKQAKSKNSKECAFARACRKQKGVKAAYFFRTAAYLEYENRLVRYLLPPSVQKEVVSFDRAHVMAPGEYQISPPLKGSTMENVRKRGMKRPGRHQPGSTKIKRSIVHRTTNVRTATDPDKG